MRPAILYILTFYLLYGSSVAQPVLDQPDSILIRSLLKLSLNYRKINSDSAEIYAKRALALAKKGSSTYWQAASFRELGSTMLFRGGKDNQEKALKFARKSLVLFTNLKDSLGIFSCLINISNVYQKQSDYSTALKYTIEANDLATLMNNDTTLAYSFGSLGNAHFNLGHYREANSYYEKSRLLFLKINSDQELNALHNMARCLHLLGEYDKAIRLYNELDMHFAIRKNHYLHARLLVDWAKVNLETENLREAKHRLIEALKISTASNFSETIQLSLNDLAEVYFRLNKIDSAHFYINKSIEMVTSAEISPRLITAYKMKGRILEYDGNNTEALHYYKRANFLIDSLDISGKISTTSRLLFKEKEKQFELEQAKNKDTAVSQEFMISGILVFLLLGSITTVLLLMRYRRLTRRLSTEEDFKDQLQREMTTSSTKLVVKNDILNRVDTSLNTLDLKTLPPGTREQVQQIRRLLVSDKNLDKEWDNFFRHFTRVHPEFIEKLRYNYKLSKNELKICAFIKMNLSYKEIGQILNIKPSSVKVSLYRIKKKVGLSEDEKIVDLLKD